MNSRRAKTEAPPAPLLTRHLHRAPVLAADSPTVAVLPPGSNVAAEALNRSAAPPATGNRLAMAIAAGRRRPFRDAAAAGRGRCGAGDMLMCRGVESDSMPQVAIQADSSGSPGASLCTLTSPSSIRVTLGRGLKADGTRRPPG